MASETSGTWGNAQELRGFPALNASGNGNLMSVSCASPGNCSVGGSYGDANFTEQAFLANQVNGAWANAFEAPGTGALNQTSQAQVNAVSCTTPGNCSAGGQYGDGLNNPHAFLTDEGSNTWINAAPVPGLDNLQAGASVINAMSCTSPSTCAAGGSYTDSTTATQPLVVTKQ